MWENWGSLRLKIRVRNDLFIPVSRTRIWSMDDSPLSDHNEPEGPFDGQDAFVVHVNNTKFPTEKKKIGFYFARGSLDIKYENMLYDEESQAKPDGTNQINSDERL
jgi:hypothetical protein